MKKVLSGIGFAVASIMFPLFVLAQGGGAPAQLPTTNLTTLEQVLGLLTRVADWMFAFLLVLAVIFIIIAAFKFLTGKGDAKANTDAKNAIIWALVAVGVAVLAKALVAVVQNFFLN